jgi:hypothetical protein
VWLPVDRAAAGPSATKVAIAMLDRPHAVNAISQSCPTMSSREAAGR